jgi:hypothetical protein
VLSIDPKDPSAPKRPASAFLAYSNSRRAAAKKVHKEASNADISRILSKMWKEAPEEVRKKYCEDEAQERGRYKLRIADWRENNQSTKKARTDSHQMKGISETTTNEGLPVHQSATYSHADDTLSSSGHSGRHAEINTFAAVGGERAPAAHLHPPGAYELAMKKLTENTKQQGERDRASDLIRQTLPSIGGFPGQRNSLGWAAGATGNLKVSLESSLAAVIQEGGATIQQQNEAFERQRRYMSGIEAAFDSTSLSAITRFPPYGMSMLGNRRPLSGSMGLADMRRGRPMNS